MFETAELGRKITQRDFKTQVPVLRTELLKAQQELRREKKFQVMIVLGGVDGAGKSEMANTLSGWMDPRGIATHEFGPPTEDERERPEYWRYWKTMPPKGDIAIYIGAWYSRPLIDNAYERIGLATYDCDLSRIVAFERELVNDGVLILKFWMHLGKKAQKKRLDALEKDPLTRWRVTDHEKENWTRYDRFEVASDRLIHKTNTAETSWHIVEGEDPNYRTLTIARTVLSKIRQRLSVKCVNGTALPLFVSSDQEPAINVLHQLDLNQNISKKEYKVELEKYQGHLNRLALKARQSGLSTVLVFEGADAAGKGGAIRRLVAALNAYQYKVIQIAAPTDEEKARHYMWRFWRYLPRAGFITLFDRSWYGRVLVERIEKFATEIEWKRAYTEINDFEEQLVDSNVVVVKFWIHISKEEQLKRFSARENTPYKRWKITDEDWRNREKWDEYEDAVDDMVRLTSTAAVPWTLVEGNDKRFARIKVLKTCCHFLEEALRRQKKTA